MAKIRSFNTKKLVGHDIASRLSNTIVVWTALRFGFPYWEDTDISREETFRFLFKGAVEAGFDADYLKTLRRFSAKMNDGHMFVSYSGPNRPIKKTIPIVLEKIGQEIIVRHVLDPNYSILAPGSVIKSIDGQKAISIYNSIYNLTSGSPQWRSFKSLLGIFDGIGDSVKVVVSVDHNNQEVNLKRALPDQEYRSALPGFVPKNGLIADNIYYYNLTADSVMKDINASMGDLEKAKSIIFDLRGYPKENINSILGHLLKCTEHTRWLHIPLVTSNEKQNDMISSGWDLTPKAPYLKGKIIFLTEGSTQSYPESILGYIKGLKLGAIVGRPTSGANGDIQTIHLFNDFRVFYSGTKVTNLDGTKNHIIGIIPDVVVDPTKKGLALGIDEVLQKALQIAKKHE